MQEVSGSIPLGSTIYFQCAFDLWAPSPLAAEKDTCKNIARMTSLDAFGLFAVTAMLVCYAFEKRSPWWILGFAFACLLGSAYGFLQGAWPFGLVELVWAGVAAWRWYKLRP